MVFCSIMIILRFRSCNSRFMNMLNATTNKFNKAIFYNNLKRNRQIHYILMTTNLYFFISTFPYCITFLLYRGEEGSLGQLYVHILAYTNNGFNFFVYGFTSHRYRRELSAFLKSICHVFEKRQIKNAAYASKTDIIMLSNITPEPLKLSNSTHLLHSKPSNRAIFI